MMHAETGGKVPVLPLNGFLRRVSSIKTIQRWAVRWALGCVNSAICIPLDEGVGSLNLGLSHTLALSKYMKNRLCSQNLLSSQMCESILTDLHHLQPAVAEDLQRGGGIVGGGGGVARVRRRGRRRGALGVHHGRLLTLCKDGS